MFPISQKFIPFELDPVRIRLRNTELMKHKLKLKKIKERKAGDYMINLKNYICLSTPKLKSNINFTKEGIKVQTLLEKKMIDRSNDIYYNRLKKINQKEVTINRKVEYDLDDKLKSRNKIFQYFLKQKYKTISDQNKMITNRLNHISSFMDNKLLQKEIYKHDKSVCLLRKIKPLQPQTDKNFWGSCDNILFNSFDAGHDNKIPLLMSSNKKFSLPKIKFKF